MQPIGASHSRAAVSTIVSSTGCRSVGDRLIDSQHLAGRRLLLQRLGQLAVARLHLLEQAGVLDRDHRLVGEGLQQLDLLVAERPHLGAAYDERADAPRPPASAARRESSDGPTSAHRRPAGNSSAVGLRSCTWTGSAIRRRPGPVTQSRVDRKCSDVASGSARDAPPWPASPSCVRKMHRIVGVAELRGARGDGVAAPAGYRSATAR